MKNINRDYLVTVDAKTAAITSVPKNMIFFMTDVLTSNIFFKLDGLEKLIEASTDDEVNDEINDEINEHFKESTDLYTLTLRVVKPNGEPKTIEKVDKLGEETNVYYVADLTTDYVDIPGIYDCELFIDTTINGRPERSTSDPFQYEVKKSIFYELDDIIDTKYISIEDIATIDYVNKVAVGGNVSLEGYATDKELDTKADIKHTHDNYITQSKLNDALKKGADINLNNLVVTNSISMNRKPGTEIGEFSTATGRNVTASGEHSHAEGYRTIASGRSSHAEGYDTESSGIASHAEGLYTKASNYYSHAEGLYSEATQEASHAEGGYTIANGYASHTEGYYTIASSRYQHVQGQYNIKDIEGNYAHIVGNGYRDYINEVDIRSNAHTLDWNGNAWFAGDVKVGADNKVLATKDYVDSVSSSYDNTELRKLINSKADKNDTELTGSISIGENCVADKLYTVAIGEGAYCGSMNQIAMGSWNVIDEADKYAFIFGDGDYYDDEERRSNCMTIDRSGNCWHKGNIYVGSNSHDRYSKKVLTEGDIYFDSEGHLVVKIGNTTKRFIPDN